MWKKEEVIFFFLLHWLNGDISYYILLPLRHGIYIMGSPASQAFTLGLELSFTNGFTGPSTYRWQSVGLLSLHHCICQFLRVHLHSCLSVHLYTDICLSFDRYISILLVLFSEEPWLMLLLLFSRFSHVRLCGTQWTAAHQAPLSRGILQARTLEQAAMPSSRGSSQPRDRTQVTCIAGRFFTTELPGKIDLYIYTLYLIIKRKKIKAITTNSGPQYYRHWEFRQSQNSKRKNKYTKALHMNLQVAKFQR